MNATRLDEILRRYSDAKAREVEAYLARHPAEYRGTVDPKPRPRRRSTALVAAVVAVAMIGSLFAGTDEAPGELVLYQGRDVVPVAVGVHQQKHTPVA